LRGEFAQVMPPVIDRLAAVVSVIKDSRVLRDDFPFRRDDDPVGIHAQADGPMRVRDRYAIGVTVEVRQTGRRHPFDAFHKTIKRAGQQHQLDVLFFPAICDHAARLLRVSQFRP